MMRAIESSNAIVFSEFLRSSLSSTFSFQTLDTTHRRYHEKEWRWACGYRSRLRKEPLSPSYTTWWCTAYHLYRWNAVEKTSFFSIFENACRSWVMGISNDLQCKPCPYTNDLMMIKNLDNKRDLALLLENISVNSTGWTSTTGW